MPATVPFHTSGTRDLGLKEHIWDVRAVRLHNVDRCQEELSSEFHYLVLVEVRGHREECSGS